MKTNQEYKNAALERLRGNWAPVVLATVIYVLICLVVTGVSEGPTLMRMGFSATTPNLGLFYGCFGGAMLLSFLVLYPVMVGFENAMKLVYERRDYDVVRNMKDIAISNYGHKVLGMFLYAIKILLWTFLLIIPGFVMMFAYAMTPYILEEHPEISAWDASTRSREMMKGHKFDLFYLYLSFIGWIILSLVTLGIGFLWLAPYYMEAAKAAFYNDLKAHQGEEAVTE